MSEDAGRCNGIILGRQWDFRWSSPTGNHKSLTLVTQKKNMDLDLGLSAFTLSPGSTPTIRKNTSLVTCSRVFPDKCTNFLNPWPRCDPLDFLKPCSTTPFQGTVSQMVLPQSGHDQFALVVFAWLARAARTPGIVVFGITRSQYMGCDPNYSHIWGIDMNWFHNWDD